MSELLWLLLPLAAASGWLAARRSRGATPKTTGLQRPAYFRGLNHLLNEEPDKAIDIFVQLLEVDSETVETHLALGNLFRRRGEVERAIRIHQNLIARPALTREQRGQALLELGQDYMRAGLFDRAENLFKELREMRMHLRQALTNLKMIYEQEKDWSACLEIVEQLSPLVQEPLGVQKSHYYCEMAEQAIAEGEYGRAEGLLKKALGVSKDCVRALHQQAGIALRREDYKTTVRLLKRAVTQDANYLPEVLPTLIECHKRLDDLNGLKAYLKDLVAKPHTSVAVLALADLIRETEGKQPAADFLVQALAEKPNLTGLQRLIQLNALLPLQETSRILLQLEQILKQLLSERPHYQCQHCGFSAKTLHWQCPSCRHWGSIKHKSEPEECQQISS